MRDNHNNNNNNNNNNNKTRLPASNTHSFTHSDSGNGSSSSSSYCCYIQLLSFVVTKCNFCLHYSGTRRYSGRHDNDSIAVCVCDIVTQFN